MNLVLRIGPKCRQGEGEGVQNPENIADFICTCPLTVKCHGGREEEILFFIII